MNSNDDVLVVIVGDNDKYDEDQKFVISGKDEKVETVEAMAIEEIVDRAEKHGEYIEIDIDEVIKREPVKAEYYSEGNDNEDQCEDNECVGEDDEGAYEVIEEYLEPVEKQSKKNGPRGQMKSFVKELKADNPELAHNQKKSKSMLVDALATIMRNVKAPPLPRVFCTLNDNGHYTCNKCDHKADTLPAAGRHHQEAHGERYLICYACGVDFRSTTNLYKHEKRCMAPDAKVVLKARALFLGQKGQNRPFIRKVSKSFVKELKADNRKLARSQKMLVDTLATIMRNVKAPALPEVFCTVEYRPSNVKRQYKCIKCDYEIDSEPKVGRHYQESHGERYLTCFACGLDFRSTANLYRHEKRCPAPDAKVVQKARALFRADKNTSKVEPKKDSPDEPFCCELCPAKLFSPAALRSHQLLHRGLRPFRCERCPAAYTSPHALKRHSLKHTGIQFVCDHCQRPFSTKAALVVHLNRHKPEKTVLCTICGKLYWDRVGLRTHMQRNHTRGALSTDCRMCPKKYIRMSSLKTHMLKQHGMQLVTKKMFHRALPNRTDEEHIWQTRLFYKTEEQRLICEEPTLPPEPTEITEIEIPVPLKWPTMRKTIKNERTGVCGKADRGHE